jgi:hypothetical protein
MHGISIATQGIIFFGTPHRRDRRSSVGVITAKAVRSGFPSITGDVVKAIGRDSSLEYINNTFQDYLEKREPPVHIVSFYERRRKFYTVRYLDLLTYLVFHSPN